MPSIRHTRDCNKPWRLLGVMGLRFLCALVLASAALSALPSARAQSSPAAGFQVNRYEPTAAGEWGFLVDHPYYSSTRYFAGGITLNYGHNPLVRRIFSADGSLLQTDAILAHQLIGHVDLAGSFLDRVTVSLSLPVTLLEQGQSLLGVTPTSPAVGDPRIGAMVRVFGQPDASPISLSVGGYLWVPLRSFASSDVLPPQASDASVRGLPKLVLAGLASRIRWSASLGFLIRPSAQIGSPEIPDGATVGHEAQIGALVQYADTERRFAIGPEFLLSTSLSQNADQAQNYTSMELLLGAQYNIARVIQVGLAGGIGILRQPGTPDARGLLRIAYAPLRKPVTDRDHDGVTDEKDICPDDHQGAHPDEDRPGCPAIDRDGDGVFDREDMCPTVSAGANPDPDRRGCPLPDRDGDGVLDPADQCPDVAAGAKPDPARIGCPLADRDGDGVLDASDQCPDVAQGDHPDPKRSGCPDTDTDKDGVYDSVDRCKDVPQGPSPDRRRPGCPAGDYDGDGIPDDFDACPERPGIPSSEPNKNGCPGLVSLSGGTIKLSQRVYFKHNRDTIQKVSYPLLLAVATLMKAKPDIRRVEVQGHTDDRGVADYNLDLSDRRAKSVMRFLVEQGVDGSRLVARGYGDTQPVASNKTVKGRTKNRRVVFVIIDPSTDGGTAPAVTAPPAAAIKAEAESMPAQAPASATPAAPADAAPAQATAPTSPPVIDLTAKLAKPADEKPVPQAPAAAKKGKKKKAGAAPAVPKPVIGEGSPP